MGSRVDVVHEPRPGADQSPDPERPILPAESLGHACHRGLCASVRPADLPVGGAGGEGGRNHREQLRSLQVVSGRKRLARTCPPAVAAAKARDPCDIARLSIRAEALEPRGATEMAGALGPRAERRNEPRGTYRFCGMLWPAHAEAASKMRTRTISLTSDRFFTVRQPAS